MAGAHQKEIRLKLATKRRAAQQCCDWDHCCSCSLPTCVGHLHVVQVPPMERISEQAGRGNQLQRWGCQWAAPVQRQCGLPYSVWRVEKLSQLQVGKPCFRESPATTIRGSVCWLKAFEQCEFFGLVQQHRQNNEHSMFFTQLLSEGFWKYIQTRQDLNKYQVDATTDRQQQLLNCLQQHVMLLKWLFIAYS